MLSVIMHGYVAFGSVDKVTYGLPVARYVSEHAPNRVECHCAALEGMILLEVPSLRSYNHGFA